MRTPTYLDSGVLIAAVNPQHPLCQAALSVLSDPRRELLFSVLVELETLPLPTFNQRAAELELLRATFSYARRIEPDGGLYQRALNEACRSGLDGMDAMHVALAVTGGAVEFVTAEKPDRKIHRTKLIRTVSLHDGVPAQRVA